MVSPEQKDRDRFAENFYNEFGELDDETAIRKGLKEYMEQGGHPVQEWQLPAIADYGHKKKIVSTETLHKLAGGKDLKRDQQRTAKQIMPGDEYYKGGARRGDRIGIDTPTKIGKIKGRQVKGYATKVTIRGNTFVRFRDKKGRFIKVSKPKQ